MKFIDVKKRVGDCYHDFILETLEDEVDIVDQMGCFNSIMACEDLDQLVGELESFGMEDPSEYIMDCIIESD